MLIKKEVLEFWAKFLNNLEKRIKQVNFKKLHGHLFCLIGKKIHDQILVISI